MTIEEGNLIEGLFRRLAGVNPGAKDSEADALIQKCTTAQPDAPYMLVQTLLVQEHALQNAQAKIADLLRQLSAHPDSAPAPNRSFLSGLLHPSEAGRTAPVAPSPVPPPLPYPSTVGMAPSAGGGFLRSALATAAGVAGGSLLFQGIENLLGHNAGAFGSAIGGGFGGTRVADELYPGQNTEITNNYYEGRPGGHAPEQDLAPSEQALPPEGSSSSEDDASGFDDPSQGQDDGPADSGGDSGGGDWA